MAAASRPSRCRGSGLCTGRRRRCCRAPRQHRFPPSDVPGLYALGASIRASTASDYARRLREFVQFCGDQSLDFLDETELDSTVCLFFEVKFREGAPAADGSKFLAALSFARPSLRRRVALALPRASRSLRGWTKHAPPDQRLPLPLVLLCVVLGWLLRRRMTAEALCLLLQFQTYLRPGEITGLRRSQLVEPRPTAGAAYDVWAINIAPFSEGRPAKTGLFDESLTIDRWPWLGDLLGALKGQGAPNRPLWPFGLPHLARVFSRAVVECHLSDLRPVL